MKIARDASEVPAAVGAARREAAASFGDDRLLLERLVARPRHLEVQVLADARGSAVHLGERDCSVQRRHQKVIEEAPGPGVSAELRAALGGAAVAAAEAVAYEGAGTVEFIVDENARTSSSLPEFFFMVRTRETRERERDFPKSKPRKENSPFLPVFKKKKRHQEMNTRLQVEHPVTEAAISGHPDLVEWQLRVAAGEGLPSAGQRGVSLSGSVAVEGRLYAERPEAGFLPAAGVLSAWRPPRGALAFRWPGFDEEEATGGKDGRKRKGRLSLSSSSSNANSASSSVSVSVSRVDAGVSGPGDAVGVHYDPMIAKVLAAGPTREAALDALAAALEGLRVGGLHTNAGLLWRLSRSAAFREAGLGSVSLDTHFLETHSASLLRAPRPGAKLLALAVAAVHAAGAMKPAGAAGERRGGGGAWSSADGARPGARHADRVRPEQTP